MIAKCSIFMVMSNIMYTKTVWELVTPKLVYSLECQMFLYSLEHAHPMHMLTDNRFSNCSSQTHEPSCHQIAKCIPYCLLYS